MKTAKILIMPAKRNTTSPASLEGFLATLNPEQFTAANDELVRFNEACRKIDESPISNSDAALDLIDEALVKFKARMKRLGYTCR